MTRLLSKVCATSWVRTFLSCLVFNRFSIVVQHFLVTCSVRVRFWSSQTPKYFITSHLWTAVPFMLMMLVMLFTNCTLDPNMMNSVLPSFIFNLLKSIQFFILDALSSRFDTASVSACLSEALKVIYTVWSLAKPWRSGFFCQIKY